MFFLSSLVAHSVIDFFSTDKMRIYIEQQQLINSISRFNDWCNKGCGMYYPVCGMVHIKEPLLLIRKSSLCGSTGFPFSLSEWSLTMSDAI